MLKFGNKEFNNLQEQVLVNANEIESIKQSLGEALPEPIPGPQGPVGPEGPQGKSGTNVKWTIGTDLPASANPGDIHLLWNGDVYQYSATKGWVLEANIRGSQGVEGPRGFTGPQGERGPQGLQGRDGKAGPIYNIAGELDATSDLPDPETVDPNTAYIINDVSLGTKYVYGIINNEWVDLGPLMSTGWAASVNCTPANILEATNVQDAINQLSYAWWIKIDPYSADYSEHLGNHVLQTTALAETNKTSIAAINNNMPRTLNSPMPLDTLSFSNYTNFGYTPTQLNNYDFIRIVLENTKNISGSMVMHPGVYYFRKVCYRNYPANQEHVIFELPYNATNHNVGNADLSICLECTKNGTVLSYVLSPNNSAVVHRTGDESIVGNKSFTQITLTELVGPNGNSINVDELIEIVKALA
jgi:hypothetical protein